MNWGRLKASKVKRNQVNWEKHTYGIGGQVETVKTGVMALAGEHLTKVCHTGVCYLHDREKQKRGWKYSLKNQRKYFWGNG